MDMQVRLKTRTMQKKCEKSKKVKLVHAGWPATPRVISQIGQIAANLSLAWFILSSRRI